MINLIKLFDNNDFYKRLSNIVIKMRVPLNLQHVNHELFFDRENINTRNTIILFDESLVEKFYPQLMQLSVANSMVYVFESSSCLSNSKALEIADHFLKNDFDSKECAAILKIAYRTVMTDEEQNENQILLSGKISGYTNKTIEVLLNQVKEGVFWKDAQSIYFGCNQQFCKDFGIKNPQEVIGKTDRDFLNEKDYKEFIAYDQQVLESGRSYGQIEKEITLQTGKIWIKLQKFPIKDRSGKTYGILGLYHRMTDEKQADKDFKLRQKFLEKLLEVSSDSIYFKDEQSNFLLINKAHAELLNVYDPVEVYGKNDFDYMASESAKQTFADEQQIIFENIKVENKLENVCVNDRLLWLNSSKYPVSDEFGTVQGIIGISRNVTDEMQLKEQLNHTKELLKEIVNTSDSAILIKDKQLNILDANKAAVALFGVQSVQDLVGNKEIDFVDEAMVASIMSDDLEVLNSGVALLNKISGFIGTESKKQLKISRIPVKEDGTSFGLVVKIRF